MENDMVAKAEQYGLQAVDLIRVCELNNRYWDWVDHPADGEVCELYAEEGIMSFGQFVLDGREAIRAFFAKRNAQVPPRYTRHVSTNLLTQPLADGAVRVKTLVTVYAGIGVLPLGGPFPSTVLDFDDICRADEHGRWRYLRRSGTPIFLGPGSAAFLSFQLDEGHPLKTQPP